MKKEHPAARILVVDDEEDTRTMLYELLTSEGHAVSTAPDAVEGLKIMNRSSFDVVITDMRMPMMEGMEFLAKIKATNPAARVIILTAYGNNPLYQEALEKGANDMLLKPIKNRELLQTLKRVLKE